MRQAEDPPQLVIGHALAIADDDQCGRRLATAADDLARALLDPIHDGERERPQQICDSVFHEPTICAERTKNNLTNMCAPHIFRSRGHDDMENDDEYWERGTTSEYERH